MIKSNYLNALFADLQSYARLLKGAMTSILLVTAFVTVPSYAANTTLPTPISRAEAANPNNFKFISINGRMVGYATEPCALSEGLISCALKKLELINGSSDEVDADYDVAQSFVFPSKANPKTAVVVITRSGLMDDSVSAERYRVSFKRENQQANAGWELVQYGVQYQCARGDKAGKWTKMLCP